MQQDFILKQWAFWPNFSIDDDQCSSQATELLSDVPIILKRRLTPLARTVFCAARQCLDHGEILPLVFSSSHGELAKSFAMMEQLEAGEEISPTTFSLSVHNAISGLLSMVQQNQLPSLAIAPGEEGMAAAFIEALGLLQEGAERVLLVFYDEPIVDFYPTAPYRLATDQRLALALKIGKGGTGTPVRLSLLPDPGDDGEQPWQLPAFIDFLNDSRPALTLRTPRHGWRWERHAAPA